MVVFDDADLAAVVENLKVFSYWNAGQDCTAPCRVITGPKVYDNVVADLTAAVETISWGDPAEGDGIEMGSLIAKAQADKVEGMVDRARAGAEVVTGGHRPDRPRCLLRADGHRRPGPAERDRPGRGLRAGRHGPAVQATRSRRSPGPTTSGSGSRPRSGPRDIGRAMRVAKAIQFGTVWVNDHFTLVSEMPHGGFKESGYGKDQSMYAIEDYTVVKHVMLKV